MQCEQCGHEFNYDKSLFFCPRCGAEIARPDEDWRYGLAFAAVEMQAAQQESKGKRIAAGRPQRYLKFLLDVGIFFWAAVQLVSVIRNIVLMSQESHGQLSLFFIHNEYWIYNWMIYLFPIAEIVALLLVRGLLKRYRRSGYNLMMAILAVHVIFPVLIQLVRIGMEEAVIMDFVSLGIIGPAIFVILNLVYFLKRRLIFDE